MRADPWVGYLLRGVEEIAAWTTAKIEAIRTLAAETVRFVRAKLPKIYSREFIDVILEQPYCRMANRGGGDEDFLIHSHLAIGSSL